jgi:hypothetical protein
MTAIVARRHRLAAAVLLGVVGLAAPARAQEPRYYTEGRKQVRELTGSIPGTVGRVRVETDRGVVRIHPATGDVVAYRIRLRAGGPNAAEVRRRLDRMAISASRSGDLIEFSGSLPAQGSSRQGLEAEFDIGIPAGVGEVVVATGAGDIEALGAGGKVSVLTRGGRIVARDIAGPLLAETRGGDVLLAGAAGSSARLVSAGGNVSVDSTAGDLTVQTSGGDVRIGRAGGEVRVETGGGNVRIDKAGRSVTIVSNGGAIEIGEAAGAITAASAGGGIRVGTAAGGIRCETAAGPIVLDGVEGAIRAVTSSGSIHALLEGKGLLGDSDLQAWQGDIVVSLPEAYPVTIRALIDSPVGQGIESDFPLRILRDLEDNGRPVLIGEGAIGGGGPVLKIHTLGGRIHILKAKNTKPVQR